LGCIITSQFKYDAAMNKLNPNSSIFSIGWIDLIFENLNQQYGAYVIRRLYRHLLGNAILLIISLIAGTVVISNLVQRFVITGKPESQIIPEGVFNLDVPPLPALVLPPVPLTAPPSPSKVTTASLPKIVTHLPDPVVDNSFADPGIAVSSNDPVGPSFSTLPIGSTASTNPGADLTEPFNKVHLVVEVAPSFPGGDKELIRYLKSKIRYPDDARSKGISGIVYVTFTITNEGTVSDVVLSQGIGSGCDEEAIRVISAMPKWKPGKQSGIPVSVRFNLPIRFAIR
jgi:protein TonB